MISEVGGRTLYRLLARDAGGETEGVLLNETVPAWVVDIVVEKKLPKFIKVSSKSQLSVLYSMFPRSRFSFCLILPWVTKHSSERGLSPMIFCKSERFV